MGIDESKLNILYNPVPSSVTKNSFNSKSKYVLYAGRVDSSKGVDLLIDAWVKSQIKDMQLKIIGEGDLLNSLIDKYENETIKFMGSIPNTEVIKEIQNSRAVLTATKMYEGQPRLLAEASSMGIPSIFPEFGGMAEYYPRNYELSFEQYNYEDLIQKIDLLQDRDLLERVSNSILLSLMEPTYTKKQLQKLKEILIKLKI